MRRSAQQSQAPKIVFSHAVAAIAVMFLLIYSDYQVSGEKSENACNTRNPENYFLNSYGANCIALVIFPRVLINSLMLFLFKEVLVILNKNLTAENTVWEICKKLPGRLQQTSVAAKSAVKSCVSGLASISRNMFFTYSEGFDCAKGSKLTRVSTTKAKKKVTFAKELENNGATVQLPKNNSPEVVAASANASAITPTVAAAQAPSTNARATEPAVTTPSKAKIPAAHDSELDKLLEMACDEQIGTAADQEELNSALLEFASAEAATADQERIKTLDDSALSIGLS